MDKALAEYPDIKLIARQPGEWDQARGRQVMEDWIVAYPKIDAVFAQNDSLGGRRDACSWKMPESKTCRSSALTAPTRCCN